MKSLTDRSRNEFYLWLPDIFQFKGGIQVYLAFFLKALQSLYPHHNYEVFLKNDSHCTLEFPASKNTKFHFTGSFPQSIRTIIFAARTLVSGLWKRPDLVITGHLNFAVLAYWLKKFTGVPYWILTYGIEAWDIKQPALQKALCSADRIISISSYTRDRLVKEQNLDPAKISLLPCTFDANRFQIKLKPQHLLDLYKLNANQPIILTVARLDSGEQYKGYGKILEALPEIRRQIPNVHYLLVGKGCDRTRIEGLITQLNLQDCVTLAGFVPDEQLCDYYNLCDVFAMPSKKEGFGIVFLEALACGKPVLAGNQDGSVDALCNGKLGALIDPDNVEEIAQTLVQILQGNYPNKIIYQPETLRQKVIDIYEFTSFTDTLSKHIDNFLNS